MKCSKCPKETGSTASIMCPECHAAAVAKVHAHDTPTTPELTGLPKYAPEWLRGPHPRGRRCFKNEKGQG